MSFIELGCVEDVLNALATALDDKQFKVRGTRAREKERDRAQRVVTQVAAAAGAAITRALHEFGPKVVSLKLVNPCLSKLLSNTNGKVLL